MRNFLLAFSALASLALPASARPLAFVINSGEATLSLIDPDTRAEIKRIPLLREPDHMALTPDGASLLIGDTAGNAVLFVDPQTGEMQRRQTMSDPYQLVFSPDAKTLVVAGLGRNQIDLYDAKTLTLAHRIPASSMPSHINFAPDSSVAYVSLQGSDSLMAIDTRSGGVLWTAKVGPAPAGVMWLNGRVLVGVMGADYVSVVDPASGAVERRVQTGKGAHNLFLSPDGRTLYVCNRVDGSISLLDPKTLAVRGRWVVPGGPDDLDFAADGKIWVTRRWQHSVAIIDPATGQFTTIETGRSPHGIWLNTHQAAPTRVSARD
jgi:DNA-binding beta-propeller fold protein YncE